MQRWLPLSFLALLLVLGAVVHGAVTHRWSLLANSADQAERVRGMVLNLRDYQSREMDSELPVRERSAVAVRHYTAPGRESFIVSITTGPPGAVATHTPDVCYPGSGYRTARAPKVEMIELPNGRKARFLVAEYEKKSETSVERQRIRWSWSADGTWDVPSQPRFAYIHASTLYKLYFVTQVPAGDSPDGDSPAVRELLAQAFLQYSAAIQQP